MKSILKNFAAERQNLPTRPMCRKTGKKETAYAPRVLTGVFCDGSGWGAAANSVDAPDASVIHDVAAANSAIEATAAGGWKRIAKFGEHWHDGMGRYQVFGPEQARAMVAAQRSTWQRLKERVIFGSGNAVFERNPRIPVKEGHPDVPGFAGQPGHDDTADYGGIEEMEARDDGLWGRVSWSAAGNALLESGKKLFFSPYWTYYTRAEDNKRAFPVRLLSVGLVQKANISGSAANGQSTQNSNQPNNTMLKKLLIALGLADAAADAAANSAEGAPSEAEVLGRVTDLQTRAAGAEKLKTDLAAANARATSEENEHARTREALAAANARADAERKARAETVVDEAVANGVVTGAQRDAKVTELAGVVDFAAAANALAGEAKALKTAATADVSGRRAGGERQSAAEAGDTLRGKAREIRAAANGKIDWDTAWQRAKRENPNLAATMAGADETTG